MKKVLIIDDNPKNVSCTIAEVQQEYFVEIVMDLSSAERLIKMSQYDLIVIDVMMPAIGTWDISEIETGLHFYKKKVVPIINSQKTQILFWSHFSKDKFIEFFHNGIPDNVGFLHKNIFDEKHLLVKIRSMLN